MQSNQPSRRFVALKKPKHKEEYSLKECAAFQPWKVTLKVEQGPLEDPVDYVIFCRAPRPVDAQTTAYSAFWIWTHLRTGREAEEFPRVSTSIPSEADRLSEDQWDEFWKEAQLYPHVATGDPPTIFRFVKPGWDLPGHGMLKPGRAGIIVPDTSTIKKIDASRNRQ